MKKVYFKQLVLFALVGNAMYPQLCEAKRLFSSHCLAKATPLIFQNAIEVSGTVRDVYGNPLYGVKVSVKENGVDALTDKNGKYSINAEPGEVLVFMLNGYLIREVQIENNVLNVTLAESQKLEELTPILYGYQKRSTQLQSTATVYTPDLVKVPVVQINNALTGRLAGLYTLQSSGRPGADGTSLTLRGSTPLVLVNGVPRDYPSIDPEEIESVTVLKDGLSTVMLGQQASNGVVLITTRKGETGKQRISFTAQTGLQTPSKLPKPLDAYNYARLYNEALANAGQTARYSNADLVAYRDGTDPIGHPDVDWYDTILEPNAKFSRYNLNTYGGGNSARYYVGVDYLDQGGLFKTDANNSYNTNSDYKRYLVRSNIDVDITPTTFLNLNLFGRIQTGNQPGGVVGSSATSAGVVSVSSIGGTSSVFNQLATTPNNAYPVYNSNGSLGGTTDYQYNLWGATTQTGYYFNTSRDVSADISLKKILDNITKGLWFKALAAFNTSVSENIVRIKPFSVYKETTVAGVTAYQKFGNDAAQGNYYSNSGQIRNLYADFSTGWDRNFSNHALGALIKLNTQSYTSGSTLPLNYTNLAGRFTYDYKEKYLAELALSYSGLNRYSNNNRFGLFYGAGLGWNLTKEDFLKDNKWLNNLKIRATYAYTGNANIGYFVYNQYYSGTGNAYFFGTTPVNPGSYEELTLANPNATWEKANKTNIGFDASIFNNHLTLSADYFNNRYFELMQTRGRSISLLGNTYPLENIGVNRYTGVEFDLRYSNNIGNFNYFVAPNVYSLNKTIIYQDEVDRMYEWMIRTGQSQDQVFGYIAEGLFQTQQEISNSAKIQGYNPVPGDIKYKDLNGDGIINDLDVTALKNNKPMWYYGVNFGFSYKGFDFSALIQGVSNRFVYVSGNTVWAFQNGGLGQAFEQNLGRWTAQTAATATQPRLTIGSNPNNEAVSSYWMHSGDYVRLKNIEIGYTIPKRVTSKIGVSSFRIFVNAVNAITIAGYKEIDPEIYGANYPMLKVFNAGLNINL